jgi:guanylate kinase
LLLVISGPSGVGKNRWIDVATRELGMEFIVPYTTRNPRRDEVPGRDYHFVDAAQFQEKIGEGFFCEWDFTLGNYYGSGPELKAAVDSGRPTIIHALARMAIRLHARFPSSRLLFLDSTCRSELERRLRDRGYGDTQVADRSRHWDEEAQHQPLFDRVIPDAAQLCSSAIRDCLSEEFKELQARERPDER